MTHSLLTNRWFQLAAGIVGMISVTNLQYGWTFFVHPINARFGWEVASIRVAFTIFVLAETWLVPIEAFLADFFGTRRLVFAGGILVTISWVMNSWADSLFLLYLGNGLGGAGAGIVYGISIGNALRWFPDRRGLAAGLTAAAFGAGSALTVLPLRALIDQGGYEAAFFWFGLFQGGMVMLIALVMRTPRLSGEKRVASGGSTLPDFTPLEMLRTPLFWLMYVMMTLVTVGGLHTIAELESISRSLGVMNAEFWVLGAVITALSLAALLERIMSGVTRPIFGWVSDQIGRENTMFIAFSLESLAILFLLFCARIPEFFVASVGLTLFFWGEIYSLFPALCGDMFGRRYAATNYGLLYTAKGTASLLLYFLRFSENWKLVFYLAIVFDFLVAFTALLVLKPWRRKWQGPGMRDEGISP